MTSFNTRKKAKWKLNDAVVVIEKYRRVYHTKGFRSFTTPCHYNISVIAFPSSLVIFCTLPGNDESRPVVDKLQMNAEGRLLYCIGILTVYSNDFVYNPLPGHPVLSLGIYYLGMVKIAPIFCHAVDAEGRLLPFAHMTLPLAGQ